MNCINNHLSVSRYIVLCLSLMLLLSSGCSVIRFQDGLEIPSESVIASANQTANVHMFPKPITEYEHFAVSATPEIDVTVYARESESATANVFFVHGAGGGAWAWEYFFENADQRLNLYALNWRGHFDSTLVTAADADDYVVDQNAVIRRIRARNDLPIHIVGHSYGAATAIIQLAESTIDYPSVTLLAPVVPLDYTVSQRIIIPLVAPYFIRKSLAKGEQLNGTYGGMFLSDSRREYFFNQYASKDFSREKPGLIAGSGVSPRWQTRLEDAYKNVAARNTRVLIVSAQYDNVVVPRRQQRIASLSGIPITTVAGAHYLPLDYNAEDMVSLVEDQIRLISSSDLE